MDTKKNHKTAVFRGVMELERIRTPFIHIVSTIALVAIYSGLGYLIVPDGVNQVFLLNTFRISIILASIIALIMIVYPREWKIRPMWPRHYVSSDRIAVADLLLLFLPMTPIAQYIVRNFSVLGLSGSFSLALGMLLIGLLACFALPLILSRMVVPRFTMLLAMGFAYVIFNMAAFSAQFEWHLSGEFYLQLLILVFIVGALFFLHSKAPGFTRAIVVSYSLIIVLANLISVYEPEGRMVVADDGAAVKQLDHVRFMQPVNVYYLTYESYGNDAAHDYYGIDNQKQLDWLTENEFKVLPGAYTLASASLTSISRVFAMDTQLDGKPRTYIAGKSPAHQVFKNNGYHLIGIFSHDYLIQNAEVMYDAYFPKQSDPVGQVFSAIAEGEFRFDVSYQDVDYDQYIAAKREAIRTPIQRKFVYSHNRLPAHSQNSGRCRPDEIPLYEERLRKANREMRADVSEILATDPDAVIVLAGDHGPYLTENCMYLERASLQQSEIDRIDIQDRLGILMAVRWPPHLQGKPCDIKVLQDVFPVMFSMLAQDSSLLDMRVDKPSVPQGLGGVTVQNGRVVGGRDDGMPLFDSECHAVTK